MIIVCWDIKSSISFTISNNESLRCQLMLLIAFQQITANIKKQILHIFTFFSSKNNYFLICFLQNILSFVKKEKILFTLFILFMRILYRKTAYKCLRFESRYLLTSYVRPLRKWIFISLLKWNKFGCFFYKLWFFTGMTCNLFCLSFFCKSSENSRARHFIEFVKVIKE